jgi:hypothetical protein
MPSGKVNTLTIEQTNLIMVIIDCNITLDDAKCVIKHKYPHIWKRLTESQLMKIKDLYLLIQTLKKNNFGNRVLRSKAAALINAVY